MDAYKTIKEESYESINSYLNQICKYSSLANPLAAIMLDNKKYLVTRSDNEDVYTIAYEKDGDLRVCCTEDKDGVFSIVDDNDVYRYKKDEYICKRNINSNFQETFYGDKTEGEIEKEYFVYEQVDPFNKRDLIMHYYVSDLCDPQLALPYINNRYPDLVTLNKYKLFLNRYKTYSLVDKAYVRLINLFNNFIYSGIKIDRDYLLQMFSQYGFNRSVPDELIDIYKGDNEDIKSLHRVTNAYKKNTRL